MYSGGARAARKICTKTVEDGCPNCRCIRRMAVRTLNGSAIQARLRSASSTGVPGKGMASRRSFSRSTALLKYSSRGTCIAPFPGSSSVEPLSSCIFCSGFSKKCNTFNAICHHFNKDRQESIPVTGISHIQNSKTCKKTIRDGVPSPTCAVRFVKTSSKPLDHQDIPNGENHEANCIVTTLCKACDI